MFVDGRFYCFYLIYYKVHIEFFSDSPVPTRYSRRTQSRQSTPLAKRKESVSSLADCSLDHDEEDVSSNHEVEVKTKAMRKIDFSDDSKNKKCDQKIKTEVDHERKTRVKESGNDSEVFESSNQEDDVKKQPSDDEMKSDCESQRIQSKEVSPSKNGNLSEVFGNPTQSCDNVIEEKIDGKIDSCDNVSEEKVDDKPNIDEKIDEKHENDAKCTEESIDESKTFLFILVGLSIIYKGNVV